MSDTVKRSTVKTITWRIIGSSSTFLIAYFATGQLGLSSGIAVTQLIANTILYWIHERIWNKIKWNRTVN